MPRVERFGEHVHRFGQILLYLRGAGVQHLGGKGVPIGRGSLLVIPPGTSHRFEKLKQVRPICLVIDIDTVDPLRWEEESCVSSADLAHIEKWLIALHGLHRRGRKEEDGCSIQTAALILQILATLQSVAEGNLAEPSGGPVSLAVRRVIEPDAFSPITPGEVARRLGRSLDHLNRQLRVECGLTMGELINRAKLSVCFELLRGTRRSIGEIASAVGMDDQNYFTRWFRKQTGQTPTRWRLAMNENET